MTLSSLFLTVPGMYISQSCMHALIASLLVERALVAWKIADPRIRQRFRLIVVILPLLSFPVFQAISPERSSLAFRMSALFDVSRWCSISIGDIFPVPILFSGLMVFTSLIFVLQEMVPVVHSSVLARGEADETDEKQDASRVEGLLRHLTPRVPSIAIIEDEDYVLYSSTGKMRRIVVSSGVVEVLTNDELQAALAHELAHMERSERPLLAIAFVLRACQFFNPVVLFEFRRMAREEEQICDDMAVAATRKPRALGAALRKLYHVPEKARASDVVRVADFKKSLEEYGHGVELRSRIKRLERGSHPPDDRHWLAFISTIIVVSAVTYFVV